MSRFRRQLLGLVALVLAAIAIRLGAWQLDRLGERRDRNAVLAAARALPTLQWGDTATAGLPAPGRRLQARGRFLVAGEVILRSRVHREAPGVHVVTRFEVANGGGTLWVLRGFAAAADGVHPGPIPAPVPGTVIVAGELQALPTTSDGGQPLVAGGDTTWRRFDSTLARRRDPAAAPLLLYLEGGVDGPGQLPAVEPPALDEGPHLSYALQWFGIALAILAFAFVIALRRPSDRGPLRPGAAP